MGDIEILFDVCWILSPSQIQKLISQYHNADYEAPISADILKAVASRVKPDDKSDHLLLTPETDEVGPYQLPPAREIAGLETCKLWSWDVSDNRRACLAQCPARPSFGDFCFIECVAGEIAEGRGGIAWRSIAYDFHIIVRFCHDAACHDDIQVCID